MGWHGLHSWTDTSTPTPDNWHKVSTAQPNRQPWKPSKTKPHHTMAACRVEVKTVHSILVAHAPQVLTSVQSVTRESHKPQNPSR